MGDTPERVEEKIEPKGRIIPDVNALVDNANVTVTNANSLIDKLKELVGAIGNRGLTIAGNLDLSMVKGTFQLTFHIQ